MYSDSDIERDTNSDPSTDEEEKNRQSKRRRLFVVVVALKSVMSLEYRDSPHRIGNCHRPRHWIMEWAEELCPVMFRRQFRMVREVMYYMVEIIRCDLEKSERGQQQAINSSGSEISVELKIMITLRMLAGASYYM